MFTIEMLPADEGDALWIEYGPDGGAVHRVLIDCGRKAGYRAIVSRIQPDTKFELFVMTHVDADHIEGAVPLLQDPRFKPENVGDVWFNEYRHLCGERVVVKRDDQLGAQQGEYFAALLRKRGFRWNAAFDGWPVVVPDEGPLPVIELPGGMKLTLLSPTVERLGAMRKRWEKDLRDTDLEPGDWQQALALLEDDAKLAPDDTLGHEEVEWPPDIERLAGSAFDPDDAAPNGSSIAFVAEYDGKRVLFSGDAHAPVLLRSIERMLEQTKKERLELAAFKLSHHGSRRNTDRALIELVSCRRYIVSTNGKRHHHPEPETIARLLAFGNGSPELVFNYREIEQSRWDDDDLRREHGYTTLYPPDEAGFQKIVL